MKALVFRTLTAWLTIVQTLLPQFYRETHTGNFGSPTAVVHEGAMPLYCIGMPANTIPRKFL